MRRIVVLTGAGISADSGVATFRDKDGIWSRHDWRQVATPEGFAANPALVHEFYNARRMALPAAQPNAAHVALATLERRLAAAGGVLTLVTQNVDDLHERAGSANVIHMHGELAKARCDHCRTVQRWSGELNARTPCPACAMTGLRPHVVWFGEEPMRMDEIASAIAGAELLAAIGTSGSVYPAAGFVGEARALGIPTVELNLEPSENAWAFSERRYGRARDIVPAWIDDLAPPGGSPQG